MKNIIKNMKFRKFAVIPVSLLILTGCMEPRVIKPTVSFDTSAASYIFDRGDNTISGQAFLRQNGGGVVTCASSEVFIFPVNEYSNQIMSEMFGSTDKGYSIGVSSIDYDANYVKYKRVSVCDAQGNFVFKNIADGEYYLSTDVRWVIGNSRQGGYLFEKVSVNKGSNLKVLLSR